MEIINVGSTKVDPITEKYIQINSIIKEIEQMLIKTHILEWNSVDFKDYTNYEYKNKDSFVPDDVVDTQIEHLSVTYRMLKYLSDSRDPEIFDNIWFVNKEYKFDLSSTASKEHLSELFDEYILVLKATKNILFENYYEHIYFSKYIYDNITECIDMLKSYINPIKFIVKDLYINHPDYSYKFEAKYYLDKINNLVKQNKQSKYVTYVIKEHLDKIDECLSGEEIIMRLQTCYDKIHNYYNGDKLISNKTEELVIECKRYEKAREISEYINEAYIAIEKEREYMTNSWGKINMLITKIYHELRFSNHENAIVWKHWDSIEQYLKIIYDTLHNTNDLTAIISTIEEQQKNIMNVLGNYSFQFWTDDPHNIDYESCPYLKEKYILPIISFVKPKADWERFH